MQLGTTAADASAMVIAALRAKGFARRLGMRSDQSKRRTARARSPRSREIPRIFGFDAPTRLASPTPVGRRGESLSGPFRLERRPACVQGDPLPIPSRLLMRSLRGGPALTPFRRGKVLGSLRERTPAV